MSSFSEYRSWNCFESLSIDSACNIIFTKEKRHLVWECNRKKITIHIPEAHPSLYPNHRQVGCREGHTLSSHWCYASYPSFTPSPTYLLLLLSTIRFLSSPSLWLPALTQAFLYAILTQVVNLSLYLSLLYTTTLYSSIVSGLTARQLLYSTVGVLTLVIVRLSIDHSPEIPSRTSPNILDTQHLQSFL